MKQISRMLTLSTMMVFMFITFVTSYAFAQSSVIAPTDFITQVMQFIQGIGGMTTLAKISGVIVLLVASMKVTYLNTLIWSKLGNFQIWVGPILGLLAGVLSLGTGLTTASAFAYISAGAGAVFLHEILDLIKIIPGIGTLYVTIINIIEGALGGGAPVVAAQVKVPVAPPVK